MTAVLETSRLVLRPLSPEDAPAIQKHFPHWEIVQYLTKEVPWPYPDDGAKQFIENVVLPRVEKGEDWIWGIVVKEAGDDAPVGVIHIRKASKEGNRGFWLAREYHGRGYMTEAVTAVNDYVFDVLGFEKLVIKNAKQNAGSRRVKEKTGAVLVRVDTDCNYHGGFGESEVWELTRESWQKVKKAVN